MALVIILSALISFANTCPQEKVLPSLPVHDQDGLGTCASNTAALMIQHNLGLRESPSYFQLSLTTSGLKKSAFHFNDETGKRRVFNWGEKICDVINTARDEGFCDHSAFGKDVIGEKDAKHQQSTFLNQLADYLSAHSKEIQDMRELLKDPAKRTLAEKNLAAHFFNRSHICSYDFKDFIIRRGLKRFKQVIEARIPAAGRSDKVKLQKLLSEAFTASGEPNQRVIKFYEDFIKSIAPRILTEDKKENFSLTNESLPDEATFAIWWRNHLRISDLHIEYPFHNMFQSDHAAYSPCHQKGYLRDLDFIRENAFCSPSAIVSIPSNYLIEAKTQMEQIADYISPQTDPQAGIVNLLSSSCAAQMSLRKNSRLIYCETSGFRNARDAKKASEQIHQALCSGKAAGISICTGFFKASTPVDSKYCTRDIQGIEGHGNHALTLIGYRSVGGKRQFKVQNSWGPSCPFLNNQDSKIPDALAGKVECEMKDNAPTGRFWIDEDLLIKNSFRISVMP